MKLKTSKEKTLKLFLCLLVFTISLLPFVSADLGDDLAEGISGLIEGFIKIGGPVFEGLLGISSNAPEFTMQILTLILVTLVVYGILSTTTIFGDKNWINFAIGLIIALIGIRFLPENLLTEMAIPSSALVATMVLVVPFILAFFIIGKLNNPIARRVLWVAYSVMIALLWLYNRANPNLDRFALIYPTILLFSILALLFDGTLQRWWHKAEAARTLEQTSDVTRATILGEIRNLQSALAAATTQEERNRLREQIKDKKDDLKAI